MEAQNIVGREVEPLCHGNSSKMSGLGGMPRRTGQNGNAKKAFQEGGAEIFSGIFSGERDAGAIKHHFVWSGL